MGANWLDTRDGKQIAAFFLGKMLENCRRDFAAVGSSNPDDYSWETPQGRQCQFYKEVPTGDWCLTLVWGQDHQGWDGDDGIVEGGRTEQRGDPDFVYSYFDDIDFRDETLSIRKFQSGLARPSLRDGLEPSEWEPVVVLDYPSHRDEVLNYALELCRAARPWSQDKDPYAIDPDVAVTSNWDHAVKVINGTDDSLSLDFLATAAPPVKGRRPGQPKTYTPLP